ncbi:MAG TPA: LysR family transcriptional regulator [Caulobacterales bacterium]|nr:LysR family transcriptional regulator [Caulobacterales bacterium]
MMPGFDPLARAPLQALRAFEYVVRYRGFSEAATKLGVSVSALSHQIGKLEDVLGVELIVASRRRFALTERGRALAFALSEGFDKVRGGLANFGRYGPLRVAICPLLAGLVLTSKWHAIEAVAGEPIEFYLAPVPQRANAGDIAVSINTNSAARDNSIEICTSEAAPVASAAIARADLSAVPWLVCPYWGDAVAGWRRIARVEAEPRTFVCAEGLSSLHSACIQGLGVAMLPLDLIRRDIQSGSLIDLFPESPRLSVSFVLCFSRERLDHDRMQRLARSLRQTVKASLVSS